MTSIHMRGFVACWDSSKDWTINDVEVPIRQGNQYDCGVFTCMFGYLACSRTSGSLPLFDQTFVTKNKVRKRVL